MIEQWRSPRNANGTTNHTFVLIISTTWFMYGNSCKQVLANVLYRKSPKPGPKKWWMDKNIWTTVMIAFWIELEGGREGSGTWKPWASWSSIATSVRAGRSCRDARLLYLRHFRHSCSLSKDPMREFWMGRKWCCGSAALAIGNEISEGKSLTACLRRWRRMEWTLSIGWMLSRVFALFRRCGGGILTGRSIS